MDIFWWKTYFIDPINCFKKLLNYALVFYLFIFNYSFAWQISLQATMPINFILDSVREQTRSLHSPFVIRGSTRKVLIFNKNMSMTSLSLIYSSLEGSISFSNDILCFSDKPWKKISFQARMSSVEQFSPYQMNYPGLIFGLFSCQWPVKFLLWIYSKRAQNIWQPNDQVSFFH